jgi:MYXO-CTERM domain-containing protein
MKKLMIAVAALMVSIAAYGQGQFQFNNRLLPDINAPFQDTAGNKLTGYTINVLAGPTGTTPTQSVGTTDLRTGNAAGYVNAITPTVPGVKDGAKADVLLQFFAGTATTGTPAATLGPYTVTVAEAPNLPAALPLGASPITVPVGQVPEPTTLALGLVGLGTLLALRRRS